MTFFQHPPELGNQYDADVFAQEYIERVLPDDVRQKVVSSYRELGELASELYTLTLADRLNIPRLKQWDAWGNRVDEIEVTEVWKRAQVIAAEFGLVAAGYEKRFGEFDRVHQFLSNYFIQASTDTYSCPLAMTDGAAKTLLSSGNEDLITRAVPKLTSRDPNVMWTSGQWMTERIGGSDVGQTGTVARNVDEQWELTGTKWFTSATTSDMAITLARPDGNPPGSKGLAMFYLELRDEKGRMRNIEVNRLKDKFGTKKLPTAELSLKGTPAIPVDGTANGVRSITPMLNVTRSWNAVGASYETRRCVALAQNYARKRSVFGELLVDKPLHVDTLAGVIAEQEAVFHLAFKVVELLGKNEHDTATDRDVLLSRVLTPISKLNTGKQAVAIASETLEFFGGAGYVEDTGLPSLLANAQVLPIWEGTTNVLSLDTLRALKQEGALAALQGEITELLAKATDASLKSPVETAAKALGRAGQWIAHTIDDKHELEAGARRFAMTLGRIMQLALMLNHAQWCIENGKGQRAGASARRFANNGVDLISGGSVDDAKLMV